MGLYVATHTALLITLTALELLQHLGRTLTTLATLILDHHAINLLSYALLALFCVPVMRNYVGPAAVMVGKSVALLANEIEGMMQEVLGVVEEGWLAAQEA